MEKQRSQDFHRIWDKKQSFCTKKYLNMRDISKKVKRHNYISPLTMFKVLSKKSKPLWKNIAHKILVEERKKNSEVSNDW